MSGAVCVGQRLSLWWVLSGGGPVALPAAGLPYLQAPGPVRCEQDVFSWLEVEDSVGAHCSALTWQMCMPGPQKQSCPGDFVLCHVTSRYSRSQSRKAQPCGNTDTRTFVSN